jgi:hypothetical protein
LRANTAVDRRPVAGRSATLSALFVTTNDDHAFTSTSDQNLPRGSISFSVQASEPKEGTA